MSGDLARFFDRLLQIRSIDDWSLIHDGGADGRIHFSAQKSTTVVRLERLERLTLDQRLALMRPEFQCSSFFPEDAPIEKKLLQHFAPGDAIVEWCGISTAQGFPETSALRTFGMMSGSADLSKRAMIRMTVRRDFPTTGQITCAYIHVGEASQQRGNTAYLLCSTSVENGSAVLTEHLIEVPWPTFPDWWTSGLQHYLGMMSHHFAKMSEPDILGKAESMFVVASLRSCARGTPLLPVRKANLAEALSIGKSFVEIGGYLWAPAESEGFTFPTYLRRLLSFLGFDQCVFDRLDGRLLAPYQAAIDGRDWELVEADFTKLFRCQQAAYRRLRGGKGAPKVYFGTRLSFLGFCSEVPQVHARVTERNTFVEWEEISQAQGQPRSAEYP